MNDILLLKQGEIFLKGLNKRFFEQKLLENVRHHLSGLGEFRAYCLQSTLYVEPQNDACEMGAALEAMTKVFGAASVVRAAACPKEKDAISDLAVSYLGDALRAAGSFKVETRRSDKSFPMTSIELSQYVGGKLAAAFPGTPVDVCRPKFTVRIEVRDRAAYVHAAPLPGAGGLPAGTSGSAVTLLSGGIDSPVASYMLAKRGVSILPIHFFSFPYTSELAKQKVLDLTRVLATYCGPLSLQIVPFTHIQEEIRAKCPEEYFTLVMRRFMMRIAQRMADSLGAKAIVTGESLGQVASQTLEALACTDAVCRVPVLRPLIGFDKTEIVALARRIGTFELSTLPYEDCCTVFTPRHPRTKPRLEAVEDAESALDTAALVEEALTGAERRHPEPRGTKQRAFSQP